MTLDKCVLSAARLLTGNVSFPLSVNNPFCVYIFLFQVRIQDLVNGGPQLLKPKIADVAE